MIWVYLLALASTFGVLLWILSIDAGNTSAPIIVATTITAVQGTLFGVGGPIATSIGVLISVGVAAAVFGLWKRGKEILDLKGPGPVFPPASNPPRKPRHGKKLDVIRFDYFSQKGELTSRRVAVQMVGEWQFEGIDLDKGQERTFRYDSVMGDITSEETGEIQSPTDWRDSIR